MASLCENVQQVPLYSRGKINPHVHKWKVEIRHEEVATYSGSNMIKVPISRISCHYCGAHITLPDATPGYHEEKWMKEMLDAYRRN